MTTGNRGRGAGYTYAPHNNASQQERLDSYKSGNRDPMTTNVAESFTPKEGDNWIRILPPTWDNPEHYALDLWIHYEVGPDQNQYLCPLKMQGTPCPLCEDLQKAVNAGETEYARALEPQRRLLAWVIDRNEEKKGPLLWNFSPTQDRDILEQARDRRTGEILAIDHPNEGYDVEFVRIGKKLNTKYSGWKLARQPSAIDPKSLQFVVENPLPAMLQFYDPEHIMKAFGGVTEPVVAAKAAVAAPASTAQPAAAAPVAAPTAAGGNAARRARGTAPAAPDFKSMDLNALLAYADEHGMVIPDSVPDDGIAKWLAENAK